MPDTAYIFDVDNTLLDTEHLKSDLPHLCNAEFPQITPELYDTTYRGYKDAHNGYVNMPAILREIGETAGLTEPDRKRLQVWPDYIPYRDYLFDRSHKLLRSLSPDVYILSMGDSGYQPVKIGRLGLPPVIGTPHHITVTDRKDSGFIAEYIGNLRRQGYTKFTFVNDNVVQLRDAFEAAPKDVTPVLVRHGPYADEGRLEGAVFPHRTVTEFARLWQILKPETTILESRMMRPPGELK